MARACACLLLSLAAAVVGYQAKDETHVRVERLEQHVNETEFVYIRHAYVHTATRLREDTKRDAAATAAAATATAGAAAAGAATAAAGCHHTFVVPPHLPAGPICVLQEGAGAPPDAGTPAGVAATAVVDKFWAELGTHGRQLALLQRQLSDLDDSAEIGEKFEEDLVVAAAAAAAAAGGGDGGATGGGSGGATSVGLRAAVQALRRAGRAVGERVTALYARILRETVLDRGGGGGDYGGGGGQSGSRQGRTLHAARSELHKRVSEQETHSLGLHGHYVRIQSTYDALSETVGNHTATLARLGLRCCHQRPLDAQQPPPPPDPRRATSSLPSAERGADGGGGAVASPIPSPDRAWRATPNGGDSAGSETSYGCGKGGGGGDGGGGDAAGRLATGEREKEIRESERTPALATQTARRQHGAGDGWAGKQGLSAVGGGGANWAPGSDGGREVGNRGGGGAAAAPDNAVMRHGSRDAAVPPAPDGVAVRATEKPHVVLEGPWRDCQEAWDAGYRRSGRYLLRPAAGSPLLRHAWCDQERDPGGWTVVQRRSDGAVSFARDWDAYKIGFGRVEEEHWLGLQTMHALTSERNYRLLVALQDWDGRRAFAEYGSFRVESEEDNYRLRLGHFRGTAGDSMGLHHGKPFSTYDRDNDAFRGNCAHHQKGGWWYNACSHANLNGVWYEGGRYAGSEQDGAYWTTFRGTAYSLKSIVLMIRPNPNFYH